MGLWGTQTRSLIQSFDPIFVFRFSCTNLILEIMSDQDFRRIEAMGIGKVFRNQSSAQDWLAEKFSLEPHMIHVNRTEVDDDLIRVEGRILLSGVKSLKFELQIEA